MNEPIISPWAVYLLSRLDAINFMLGVGVILGIIFTTVAIVALSDSGELDDKDGRKILKRMACTTVMFTVLLVIVPSKQDAIAMYTASKITPANIQAVGESADKVADKVVEKIIRIIDATKEEKNNEHSRQTF